MRRTTILLVAALAVVAAACTTVPGPEPTTPARRVGAAGGPAGPAIFAAPVLQAFESCDAFLGYVKGHALERVGPYGLEGYGGGPFPPDVVFAEGDAGRRLDGGVPTTTAAGVAGVDYSATNVQVTGVDEPDLVKTDGKRIFAVAQGRLYRIDAGATPRVVASLPLDGWGQELFLAGDRLLVMTSMDGYGIEPLAEGGLVDGGIVPGPSPRTVLTEVDVSDPATMVPVRTLTMDGTILSSRMSDGRVRLVVRSEPTGFAWVFPEGGGIRAEREAAAENRRIVERSTLENWVPWFVLEDHQARTTSEGPLLGCDQVGQPAEFSGLSMLTVLTIDLATGLEPGRGIGLLAEGQTVYASNASLYVATAPWMAWPHAPAGGEGLGSDGLTTQIHMFDITDPDIARYVASGEVDGTLLSQWSMDEYDATLRVVVTDENPWWGSSEVPDTSVVTLRRLGDRLVQVGSVDGLGEGERVYAVRFIADRGYVVTFRQVDPLYVVDLSDPTDPRVAGELKITGYSAYLHPIGDDLLLGVGQDATDRGRVLGTQVAVFDVSDPSRPRRLAKLTVDEAYSDVEWDHRAFLWWPPEGVAVLPLQRWSWDERTGKEDLFSGAVVVRATSDRVVQVGEIRHPSTARSDCPGCTAWSAPIVRSLVIDDRLFTVSDAGVLVSDLGSYDDLAWVPFTS